MPCRVVLGGQWGDEGKGKVVDYLSARADVVVRFQGGANAGHTLVEGNRKVAVHLVPSGILHPGCEVILGNGMVIDPIALLQEISELEALGLEVRSRLRVSSTAHLVLPYHKLQDRLEEIRRGGKGIGTTGRGIGPAYADKAARSGLQTAIFQLPEAEMRARLHEAVEQKKLLLLALSPETQVNVEGMVEEVVACREALLPLLCDTTHRIHSLIDAGKSILLEGAQGALLDLDHGSYPFVTSSSCTLSGALAGSGVAAQEIQAVTGIIKAYATRVGNGPFPTEQDNHAGERLRELGQEFGATTGRPRRCGWFDAVAVRHAARLSGFTDLAVTKLDVLDSFEIVPLATEYTLNGERVRYFPSESATLAACRPHYRELPGWRTSTRDCRSLADLPSAARHYLAALEESIDVPVRLLSLGPERERTLVL